MAGTRRAQQTARNFQCSVMFEGSDDGETEGVKSETNLTSSITACKKVLCSNSVLDSSEYWLKNDRTLCRVGFLEDQHEGGCTICFVSLDTQSSEQHEFSRLQKLASISPDLPRVVECVSMRSLKEHEVILLTGLESPDTYQHDSTHCQARRAADVCMLQSSSGRGLSSIVLQINKFLIGLQCGQERQRRVRLAGQPIADDDTNRSVSSIEDDFLTASEHLGDDSEDDPLRNDADGGVSTEVADFLRSGCIQRKNTVDREDSEDSDTLCASSKSHKLCRDSSPAPTRHSTTPKTQKKFCQQTKESAGHYATNLAESVLQDAFIHLSQDEPSFAPEAAVSISSSPLKAASTSQHTDKDPHRTRTCSFELPKIVIVQSPDNCEEAAEWPGSQSQSELEKNAPEPLAHTRSQSQSHPHHSHSSPKRHSAKPVEVALACAVSVIGTISSPQVTERLTLESENEEDAEDDDEEEENGSETEQGDYSFSSALCGMAQVAGAVAVVDLTEGSADTEDSGEMFSASLGLLSAAQASTAIPLHCSVAEGTCVETFRANVAEVLLREASAVLTHRQSYTSIANFLETTHNKIVDGITRPRRSYQEHLEVDEFTQELADSIFKYALEKAAKSEDVKGNMQRFLLDSVNSLLFDVLCVTSKRFSDISTCNPGSSERIASKVGTKECEPGREVLSQLQSLTEPDNPSERQSSSPGRREKEREQKSNQEDRESESHLNEKESCRLAQSRINTATVRELADLQGQLGKCDWSHDSGLPWAESSPLHSTQGKERGREGDIMQQSSSSSTGVLAVHKIEQNECKSPVTCFAEDLATTVVSMATELAAICLENSTGKQPWFCALKGGSELPEGLLLPCRTASVLRRKETQNGSTIAKKHRPPRLSEIKRKTEEQPELMERLVNRVVDETVNLDEPATSDPFALFASEVTARIMNCPELNIVDTSKQGQPSRSRLQCERWSSRGKASSCESIPEEDGDPSGAPNTLGPGNRLGHNLSRGSSISKQSSCESITDEFSRFMVNQMETEGREFDLLLDYYAGKNASSILAAAVQQAASRKNGHLNVRTTSCLSKQSSTESITEEFYRFMLKDMDKENKDYGITKTKEWSNSLLPPTPRTPFCIRQSSVPDRRSSDSRLTVNSPIKANSFDGFARNVHGDCLNIYPSNSVSSTSLCKSDSCLYQRGQTDHITDMLIHETWASSIESLMRKNKIIAEPSEDSMELDSADSQPHVQLFANRLAADIVESGKSIMGGQQEGGTNQKHATVGERRQGFKQSRPGSGHSRTRTEQQEAAGVSQISSSGGIRHLGQREVPLIHIEPDQVSENTEKESHTQQVHPQRSHDRVPSNQNSTDSTSAPTTGAEEQRRSRGSSSDDSGSGSWAQVDDTQEETTSSFIQISQGNGNSSASSLGVADLEAFPECSTTSFVLISEDRGRKTAQSPEHTDEVTSGLSTAGSSCQREILLVNFDMGVDRVGSADSVDMELRAALQWIAASELGIPALYFRKTYEHSLAKFQRVVHLAGQKCWKVGDLFGLVVQFCQLQHDQQEPALGLFDWLLKTHR